MVIALCVLGVVAVVTTTLMMFIFVHSGNISLAEEMRERKEKMNNYAKNLAKTENKNNE